MEKFKAGDIVRLISGGPRMAVSEVIEGTPVTKELQGTAAWKHATKARVSCQWFVREKLENGSFPPESLEKVSKEKE